MRGTKPLRRQALFRMSASASIKDQAIRMKICHVSIDEICKQLGCTRSDCARWFSKPFARERLERSRRTAVDDAMSQMLGLSTMCIEYLASIVRDPGEVTKDRIAACNMLMRNVKPYERPAEKPEDAEFAELMKRARKEFAQPVPTKQ